VMRQALRSRRGLGVGGGTVVREGSVSRESQAALAAGEG
jgi:hypothetical protein